MNNTYIKSKSHTQIRHSDKINALITILEITNISHDDWLLEMFEYGCQVGEYLFPEPIRKKQLQDKQYNYWSWFLNLYLNDDKALLDIYEGGLTATEYWNEKRQFIEQLIKVK